MPYKSFKQLKSEAKAKEKAPTVRECKHEKHTELVGANPVSIKEFTTYRQAGKIRYHSYCSTCKNYAQRQNRQKKKVEYLTKRFRNTPYAEYIDRLSFSSHYNSDERIYAEAEMMRWIDKDMEYPFLAYTKIVDTTSGTVCPIQPTMQYWIPEQYMYYVFFLSVYSATEVCRFLLYPISETEERLVVIYGKLSTLSNNDRWFIDEAERRYNIKVKYLETN